eukprot:4792684-Prymnesium_polylepis.1
MRPREFLVGTRRERAKIAPQPRDAPNTPHARRGRITDVATGIAARGSESGAGRGRARQYFLSRCRFGLVCRHRECVRLVDAGRGNVHEDLRLLSAAVAAASTAAARPEPTAASSTVPGAAAT